MDLYESILKFRKHLPKLSIYEEGSIFLTVIFLIRTFLWIVRPLNESLNVTSDAERVVNAFSYLRVIPFIIVLITAIIGWSVYYRIKHRGRPRHKVAKSIVPLQNVETAEESIDQIVSDPQQRAMKAEASEHSCESNIRTLRNGILKFYDIIHNRCR